ncbi:MAG: PQQ-dependent sugar dehydrogenase [SAR324 cluster bacterium]|nr:PQQ-dependent sugar dehydrogenase [SAR324 cluster bacterium]
MRISSCFSILLYLLLISPFLWASGTENWKAPEGYEIQIDSSGWSLPVAIQFVPNPQDHPKAPLYYVSELRGRIKVVTQDHSIFTYADQIEDLRPKEELPDLKGEFGLTGLCLDETKGEVYATSVFRKGGLLFNKIMRFDSGDGKFGLQGTKSWEMIELFSKDPASHAHQIGHCFIGVDRKLYVGIGDGHQHYKAQLLQHTNGKLLRINLDGTAPLDNPFYDKKSPNSIPSYIYAYGLRNPFAIAEGPENKIYIAENGPSVDRLLKVTPGRNYMWNGKDSSMLINGIVTWSPAFGPATMVFLKEHRLFPNWNQRFLVTATALARMENLWIDDVLGAKAPPETILEYTGKQETERQYLVPVAVGPDGIYFSGFLPQADGETHIMKIVPSSSAQKTNQLQPKLSGEAWYARMECAACHSISGKGGKVGPALDNLVLRLEDQLNSRKYEQQLDEVDQLTENIFVKHKEARQQLRQLEGKEKIEFWIRQRLKEPKFDYPESQMPNFQLTDEQITELTKFLMTLSAKDRYREKPALEKWADDMKFYLTTHLSVWLTVMLCLGMVIGVGGKATIRLLWKLLFFKKS